MGEKKLFINGKETQYTVTSNGNVYSLNYNKTGKKAELSKTPDKDGYLYVTLHVDGRQIFPSVARLVAMVFIPIPEKYIDDGLTMDILQINHIHGGPDGITNNDISNLEWCTGKENIDHAYRTGLAHGLKGEKSPVHIHDELTIVNICKDIESNKYTFKEICKRNKVKRYLVDSIYYHRTWNHISEMYDFTKFNKFKSITEKKVRHICEYIEANQLSLKEIAEINEVPFHIVKSIFYRQTWNKISQSYNFDNYNKSRRK